MTTQSESQEVMNILTEGTYEMVIPWDGYVFNKSNVRRYEPEMYTPAGKKFIVTLVNPVMSEHKCRIKSDDWAGVYAVRKFDIVCEYFSGKDEVIELEELLLHPLLPHKASFHLGSKKDTRVYRIVSMTPV